MDNEKTDIFEEYMEQNAGNRPETENTVEMPPKKPFYKKTMFWVLIVIAIGLIAAITFGDYGARNELIEYNNEQVMPLTEKLQEIDNQLFEIMGNSNSSKVIACNELKSEIIPQVDELIEKADKISPKNDEVKELHGIFKDSLKMYRESLVMVVDALEKEDDEKYTEGLEAYYNASDRFEDYVNKREELRKEFDIELKK